MTTTEQIWHDAINKAASEMARLQINNRILTRCMFEEFASNGGHFASPDTHLWFEQNFCKFGETAGDALMRIVGEHIT